MVVLGYGRFLMSEVPPMGACLCAAGDVKGPLRTTLLAKTNHLQGLLEKSVSLISSNPCKSTALASRSPKSSACPGGRSIETTMVQNVHVSPS